MSSYVELSEHTIDLSLLQQREPREAPDSRPRSMSTPDREIALSFLAPLLCVRSACALVATSKAWRELARSQDLWTLMIERDFASRCRLSNHECAALFACVVDGKDSPLVDGALLVASRLPTHALSQGLALSNAENWRHLEAKSPPQLSVSQALSELKQQDSPLPSQVCSELPGRLASAAFDRGRADCSRLLGPRASALRCAA
jgi:hypothetical protein